MSVLFHFIVQSNYSIEVGGNGRRGFPGIHVKMTKKAVQYLVSFVDQMFNGLISSIALTYEIPIMIGVYHNSNGGPSSSASIYDVRVVNYNANGRLANQEQYGTVTDNLLSIIVRMVVSLDIRVQLKVLCSSEKGRSSKCILPL